MNRHKITSLPRTSNGKSRIDTPKAYNFESLTSARLSHLPVNQKKKEKKERKKEREVIFFGSHVPPNYPTHSHHTFHSTLSPVFGWLTHFHSFLFFFIFSHTLLSTLISSLTGTSTPPPPLFPPSFSNKITRKLLRTYKHLHILF